MIRISPLLTVTTKFCHEMEVTSRTENTKKGKRLTLLELKEGRETKEEKHDEERAKTALACQEV